MMIARFSTPVLLATLLLVPGCKKAEKPTTTEPAGSGSSAAAAPATPPSATPTPPPPSAPPAAAAGGDTGPVATATQLAELTLALPTPKGAPASGGWTQAPTGGDGDRTVNFTDGNDYWVTVRFLDCRLPAVKDAAGKPAADRGDFGYCLDTPTAKLKDYPLLSPDDTSRVVKAGHVAVIASLGATGATKLKAADLETFLNGVDLASLAKL